MSDAGAATAIPPPVLQLLTCLMVGVGLVLFCTGFVISLIASYFFTHGRKDSRLFKALVGYCLFMLSVYLLLYFTFAVITYGRQFGNVTYAVTPNKMIVAANYFITLIDGVITAFYAWRAIKVLQNNIFVIIVASVAVATQVAAGLYFATAEAMTKDFRHNHNVAISGPMSLITLCATDSILTGMLLFGLFRAKKNGTSHETGLLLKRLAVLAVESFLFPTLFQIVALVLWYCTAFSFLVLTPSLPTVYVGTLLFWLQSRHKTRLAFSGTTHGSPEIRTLSARVTGANHQPQMGAIHISTLKEIHVESDDSHSEKDGAPDFLRSGWAV